MEYCCIHQWGENKKKVKTKGREQVVGGKGHWKINFGSARK